MKNGGLFTKPFGKCLSEQGMTFTFDFATFMLFIMLIHLALSNKKRPEGFAL
jgi:hypothetical protein